MALNPVVFAMRRPVTVLTALAAVALCSVFALANLLPEKIELFGRTFPVRSLIPVRGMAVDIFPDMNTPVIYVAQPYGGMDAGQMEGLITNYYEYHFLYIAGIEHVESRNIQGVALMKLFFHPGTDMAQAMAETIAQVNRSRAFMPVGTVPPFVVRYDAGSLPVGFLTVSSATRTTGELQDLALFRVRPAFAAIPGVSAPPPFGGTNRTAVITLHADRLRSYRMPPDEVVGALVQGNVVSPSGTLRLGDRQPIVSGNSIVKTAKDLENIAIRPGSNPTVFIGDVASVEDRADIPTGYALVDGKRTIYLLVTKRADAGTLSVVNNLKAALPQMQSQLPPDVTVDFVFDQSPIVTGALGNVAFESLLGALLTGLTVLVFLRDFRSAIVVVLNIPLALLAACVALWLTGQTVNIMTLGGLALAVGILVDEAVVEIENIHSQMARRRTKSLVEAVRVGNAVTAVPRLLALLCILAVFVPSFFMAGVAKALFVPLSLAVGFSMIASYILSSTFVPVAAAKLLRHHAHGGGDRGPGVLRRAFAGCVSVLVKLRWIVVPTYIVASIVVAASVGGRLGTEIFPPSDAGQFRLRLRAPDGSDIDTTEAYTRTALDVIGKAAGEGNVAISVGYVGVVPATYPINSVYEWMGGPHEAVLRVALKPGSGIRISDLQERLRVDLARELPKVRFGFESGDLVAEVMSFGSPTPVEVAISGPSMADNLAHAEKVREKLAGVAGLRDLQIAQSLEFPTVDVEIDRRRAGLAGATVSDYSRSSVSATFSSRYVIANFWPDPASGIGYQVQVEIAQDKTRNRPGWPMMDSIEQLLNLPVKGGETGERLLLRDIAKVKTGTMVGQYDRYNMKRMVTLTANVQGVDLGTVAEQVRRAVAEAEAEVVAKTGEKPRGVSVDVRGQIKPLGQMLTGLAVGLALSIVSVFLLLGANYQSLKLSLAAVAGVPGVLAGVCVALAITGTTLNVQSFMGAIMAVGVSTANAILLVTFAERARLAGADARAAAISGSSGRVRAVLMTGIAMIAGMVPMAMGDGSTAPLARAVIGGLALATPVTLLVLPCVFAMLMGWSGRESNSLDPADPQSKFHRTDFDPTGASATGEDA